MTFKSDQQDFDKNDLGEVVKLLEEVVDKLDKPPKKDWSDRFGVISTFFGGVILAAMSLYLTESARNSDSKRQDKVHQTQVEIEYSRVRIEELAALTSVAPLLASKDTAQRRIAELILEAVNATRRTPIAPTDSSSSSAVNRVGVGTRVFVSMLDAFLDKATNTNASPSERVGALKGLAEIASLPETPRAERERAVNVANSIANSEAPADVRQAAAEAILRIKRVESDHIAGIIAEAPLTRAIAEIVLHHSATDSKNFRGAATVLGLAEFQSKNGWGSKISWHYAIAPDGAVWLGMPLDTAAIHFARDRARSISVLLILNGDKEMPSEEQRVSLRRIIHALETRTKLSARDPTIFTFHRELLGDNRSNCPGALITRDSVRSWLSKSD